MVILPTRTHLLILVALLCATPTLHAQQWHFTYVAGSAAYLRYPDSAVDVVDASIQGSALMLPGIQQPFQFTGPDDYVVIPFVLRLSCSTHPMSNSTSCPRGIVHELVLTDLVATQRPGLGLITYDAKATFDGARRNARLLIEHGYKQSIIIHIVLVESWTILRWVFGDQPVVIEFSVCPSHFPQKLCSRLP